MEKPYKPRAFVIAQDSRLKPSDWQHARGVRDRSSIYVGDPRPIAVDVHLRIGDRPDKFLPCSVRVLNHYIQLVTAKALTYIVSVEIRIKDFAQACLIVYRSCGVHFSHCFYN